MIGAEYPSDRDRDRLNDRLSSRAVEALERAASASAEQRAQAEAQLDDMVDVELIFNRQITQKQIDDFLALGGEITYIYRAVSYGWNGRIPLRKVRAVRDQMGPSLVLVTEPSPVELLMDTATKTGRVRPIWANGFAGNVGGFDGDTNITIAIVDSGVDDTHPDLSGRRVYWQDFSTDAETNAIDLTQHGTHVAGIALGSGASGGAGSGTLKYTSIGNHVSSVINGVNNEPILLPAQSINYSATAQWIGGGSSQLILFSSPLGGGSPSVIAQDSGASPLNFNGSLTGNTALNYSIGLQKISGMLDYVIANQITAYPASGDSFNKFRGIAPECMWAAAKVVKNGSMTNLMGVGMALDDLVVERISNNIKIMNLSLGGSTVSVRQKVNSAVNAGVMVVAAAGNDGLVGGEVGDPGRAALALTVAAANDINQLTDYTSLGFPNPSAIPGQEEDFKPDLMAPGGSSKHSLILSVDSNSGDGTAFGDQQADDYYITKGTSMAAPFAAGCAALVIDAMQQQGIVWDFTSSRHARYVKMVLCATSSESNMGREGDANNPTLQRADTGPNGFPAGKDPYEGFGMINPDAAVEAVTLSFNPGISESVSLGTGTTDRRVWARKVTLVGGMPFEPMVSAAAPADYDLYLYSETPSPSGAPVLLASSATAGAGTNESFSYTSASTTSALLVVKRVLGSGSFTLSTPVTRYVAVGNPSAASPYTNWATAAATIQPAIDVALDRDLIIVTNGYYFTGGRVVSPSLLTNRVVIDKAVTVQSVNGPDVTIIVGNKHQITNNGPSSVRCAYVGAGATLSGFTLINGATLTSGSFYRDMGGGGVLCRFGGVVSNCVLFGNSSSLNGGGAMGDTTGPGTLNNCTLEENDTGNWGGGARGLTFNNCEFINNTAGDAGGAVYQCTLNNCTVTSNSAEVAGGSYSGVNTFSTFIGNSARFGGGVHSSTLTNCTLIGNSAVVEGGGSYNSTLDNCTLTQNSANNRGGGSYGGTNTFSTFTGNSADSGGGAYDVYLNNCSLINNTAGRFGGGVYLGTLNNCTLSGNSAQFRDGGGAFAATLNNCIVQSNSALMGFGGGVIGNVTVNNCTITDNTALSGGGVAGNATLNNCIVYYNTSTTGGVNNYTNLIAITYTCTTPLPSGTGNITNAPMLVDRGAGNVRLMPTSPCINAGNNANAPGTNDVYGNPRIAYNRVDMGAHEFPAFAAVHYVDLYNPTPLFPYTNWMTAATTIQDAVDVAESGTSVMVSNGVYAIGGRTVNGSSLTNRVVIAQPVTVQSVNGPDVTVIKGAGPLGNAAVRCVWMTNGASLVGFTLTNGATRTVRFNQDGRGGGVFASSSSTISNCVLTGNAAYEGGGAYYGLLLDCMLTGNSAIYDGGAAAGSSYSYMLQNCMIISNSAANGGGLSGMWAYDCLFSGNIATNNGGGSYNAALFRCVLNGNYAGNGGGGAAGGVSQVFNCLFVSNSAGRAGGGTTASQNDHCTVVFNSAPDVGGGSSFEYCIVYGNTATSTTNHNHSGGFINYTCTTPLPGGEGNITNDPQFVDAAGGNFQLLAGSPCIDAVTNGYYRNTGTDLTGNQGLVNTFTDMGAYEYNQATADYDSDGDRVSDRDEFVAGTLVTNPASFFAMKSSTNTGPYNLTFDTMTGRVYAVDFTDQLAAQPQVWIEFTNSIPGTGETITIPDPGAAGVTCRTYRVRVNLSQ